MEKLELTDSSSCTRWVRFLTFLPLYLILGVVWRFSVIAGHPVNEAKNRKWRMGFLITFGVLGVSGISLGIAGMGNASHFRDIHGVSNRFSLCDEQKPDILE